MDTSLLTFKKAAEKNYDAYFALRAEKQNLFWTGYENAPDYGGFKTWYSSRLKDPSRHLYFLFDGEKLIGSLNMDYQKSELFIGYSVIEEFQGKGLGTTLVKHAITIAKKSDTVKIIKAWINYQNIGSIKVVEKNGFHKSSVFEERNRFGNKEMYFQYHLAI